MVTVADCTGGLLFKIAFQRCHFRCYRIYIYIYIFMEKNLLAVTLLTFLLVKWIFHIDLLQQFSANMVTGI